MISLKCFIEDKSTLDCNLQNKNGESSGSCSEPEHVKNIYENIIANSETDDGDSDRIKQVKPLKTIKRVQCNGIHISNSFNINSIMKAIETNNVREVMNMMQGNEKNINTTDQFGWTPLMCACCAGAVDTTKYLLQLNPDPGVQDRKGNTCFSLAKSKGYSEIVTLLQNYVEISKSSIQFHPNNNSQNINKGTKLNSVKELFCNICHQSLKKNNKREHVTSTIHLFNAASKSKMPTMYGIPESNKGFQMLLRHGWDKEKGLGPEGSGHKFPLKTIFKQDRLGLGAKHYTTRVTHPASEIIEKSKVKCGFKQDLRILKQKEKRKERAIRRMLD